MDDKIQINKEEKDNQEEKENSQEIEKKEDILEENEKFNESNTSNNNEEKESKEEEKQEKESENKNEDVENQMVETQPQNRVIIIPLGKIIFGVFAIAIIMIIFANIPKTLPVGKWRKAEEKISYEYNENGAFLFEITENGKGEYARGKIVRGTIKVGEQIELVGLGEKNIVSTVTEIYIDKGNEIHKNVESAKIGENAEIHFKIAIDQIKIGKVLAKKDSIKTSKKVEAIIGPSEYLEKSEKEKEIENNKTYNFYIRQINMKGRVELERTKISISKEDKNFKIIIDLDKEVAVDKNTIFYLVESGKKIIECTVTKVIN